MAFERLEDRMLLAGIPYGAHPSDTAEYMLGEVYVTVVLMESDGTIDENLEDWTLEQIEDTKATVREGLVWWEETLALQTDAHRLHFTVDFTYADSPVSTRYEPIAGRSDDYVLWVEEFLQSAGFDGQGNVGDSVRALNHAQRTAAGADWAFTIFIVNSQQDADNKFAPEGSFSGAFGFSGGRFFVMPSVRAASTVAHETAHIFYAMDEYGGSKSYFDRRGYYDTQNLNALDDNPDPASRVLSLMSSHVAAFPGHAMSASAMEMIGWQDSDGDGLFDVLDLPHTLRGSGGSDPATGIYRFVGSSSVRTLPNRNPDGLGNDITINRISRAEYRIDDGQWTTAGVYDSFAASLDLAIGPLALGYHEIEIRTIDDATGVTSESFFGNTDHPTATLDPGVNGVVWNDQNSDGLWDPGEPGLEGWIVRVLDGLGQPIGSPRGVEPDDFIHGTAINTAVAGVTLSAVGPGIADETVAARIRDPASTGEQVFAYRVGGFWKYEWTSESRKLRIDFDAPVTTVSIDAVSNGDANFARLAVFDENDNLLARYTTGALARGQFETMTVSRSTPDIAYAVARGHAGTVVRLDNLRFGPEPTATTDAFGAYAAGYLPPGDYTIQIDVPILWEVSEPSSAVRTVSLAAGQPAEGVHFGVRSAPSVWQNQDNPRDVSGDGFVSPIDVAMIVSDVYRHGERMLPLPQAGSPDPPPFLDASGNGYVSLADAVLVIEYLNSLTPGHVPETGEGEPPPAEPTSFAAAFGAELPEGEPPAETSPGAIDASLRATAHTPLLHQEHGQATRATRRILDRAPTATSADSDVPVRRRFADVTSAATAWDVLTPDDISALLASGVAAGSWEFDSLLSELASDGGGVWGTATSRDWPFAVLGGGPRHFTR